MKTVVPNVSLIIPVYNVEQYLGETLNQQRRVRDDGLRVVNLCPL